MARSNARPPRRIILGILFLSVSLLTAVSLPGLGLGHATGPFGAVWVEVWARGFGALSVWAWTLLGLLWGVALLARFRSGTLWCATALLAPLLIAWNALLLDLAPASHGLYGGWFAEQLAGSLVLFFGAGAPAQVSLALLTLATIVTVLFLRWGLPAPISAWVAAGTCALGRTLLAGLRLLWLGVAGLGRLLMRALIQPAAREFGSLFDGRRAEEPDGDAAEEPALRARRGAREAGSARGGPVASRASGAADLEEGLEGAAPPSAAPSALRSSATPSGRAPRGASAEGSAGEGIGALLGAAMAGRASGVEGA